MIRSFDLGDRIIAIDDRGTIEVWQYYSITVGDQTPDGFIILAIRHVKFRDYKFLSLNITFVFSIGPNGMQGRRY